MKTPAKTQPYLSVDCNFRHVAQIQHALDELGFLVTKIVPQYSYFLGYNFRLYFKKPIPALTIEILLEASVSHPSVAFILHDN